MSDISKEALRDSIRKRVPEALQGDNTLREYLDVCSELFYELRENVKLQDHFNDYRYVPESRLAMLARKFAFSPPRNLPPEMLRGIIRDIVGIYMSKGVENSLVWVFKLLGWRAEFKDAWLLNPERFEPNIRLAFPQYYEEPGLDTLEELVRTVYLSIGDDYTIGRTNQLFASDPNFYIKGNLLFGRNQIFQIGGDGGNLTPESGYRPSTEFDKIDYRNFLFGSLVEKEEGTYFTGRRYFQTRDTFTDLRIIGEYYQPENAIRKPDVVMKTPYIVVEVNAQDYARFTSPYVDEDGTVYSYTESEIFGIAETLISYFLYDSVRPANVKIIIIVAPFFEHSRIGIESTLTMEAEVEDTAPIENTGFRSEEVNLFASNDPDFDHVEIGKTSYIIGAPSYHPINSYINSDGLKFGDTRSWFEFVATESFTYDKTNFQTSLYMGMDGKIYSRPLHLRTPCGVTLYGTFDFPFSIETQKTPDSDWIPYGGSITVGTEMELSDSLNMRLVIDPEAIVGAPEYEFVPSVEGETLMADFTEAEFHINDDFTDLFGDKSLNVAIHWIAQKR